MRVADNQIQMSNYSEFKSVAGRYGFSTNNFYEVRFEIEPSHPLYRELAKDAELSMTENKELMRLYTEEASLPGVQISTGEYRVTNSPTLKYGYGAVFSEFNTTFLMDADSRIKGVFDVWTNWIYGYTSRLEQVIGPFYRRTPKLRTRYRDDYAVDIVIIKYEKSMSSHANGPGQNVGNYSIQDIIPDSRKEGGTRFYKAIPTYAMRLFKAFPSNVSSVNLNNSSTELNKLSVQFEYETMTTSVLNDGKINGSIEDPINGGINVLDLAQFFGL